MPGTNNPAYYKHKLITARKKVFNLVLSLCSALKKYSNAELCCLAFFILALFITRDLETIITNNSLLKGKAQIS